MKLLVVLGGFLLLISSCRKYETCATYADNKQAKFSTEKSMAERADI